MSWRKKKKEIRKIKHKAFFIICLMFAVVIGLIIILTIKIMNNGNRTYKIESRIETIKKVKPIENSSFKTIGWLKVEGTNIDLPIVYSDNDTEEFPVQLESFGWAKKEFDKDSTYFDITGHNIFNLSSTPKIKSDMFNRFEELMAFVYYDFAKDNEYIQLTIDDRDYVYKIFSVGFIDKSTASFFPIKSDVNKDDIKDLIEIFESKSLYKYDINVNANDRIISLSTCTRFYGANSDTEFYVVGRLIRDDEKINHYKVTKNKKYENVLKKLKGDENNE